MARGKKKKKKLAFGGAPLDQEGINRPMMEQTIQSGASAFGPMGAAFGALGTAGSKASQAIIGEGKSTGRNMLGYTVDPYKHINALMSGNFREAVPILGELAFNKRMKGEAAERANQISAQQTLAGMQNMAGYAHGGVLKKKLGLVNGGDLEAISPDAVEVKADNPSLTDSVELEEAFVDNREVIDNKNRVFSDDLTAPSGKSIAQEAKKLEKMKSPYTRFGPFNDMIDTKLDNLFTQQEDMKKKFDITEKVRKQNMTFSDRHYEGLVNDEKTRKLRRIAAGDTDYVKHKLAGGGKIKKKMALGGTDPEKKLFSEADLYSTVPGKQVDLLDGTNPDTKWFNQEQINSFLGAGGTQPTQKRFDWNKAGTAAATFGSNVLNQALISKLAGPQRPQGESQISLPRLSANAQLGEIGAGFRGAQAVINRNVAQSSNLVSATGSMLAKRLSASNQAIDSTNRLNASIAADETGINAAINARNVGRQNQFRDNVTEFRNKKLQLTSQNAANLSEKALMLGREKNMKERDMLELSLLRQAYGDSGVYDRVMKGMLDEYLEKKGMTPKKTRKKK